ncbi:hypothetical protein GGS23DRAFT_562457 [Durotheca rogersii]|uniref:uncharacterized protein n=1 Tax=Durotheca rogersii TaxID=419775 RepID=UPI00222101C2|nr:uncharacterized protein GGS23DRAFT_562457 [Durotheca rogersii]KAI5864947.1 hypothetical protein GGS23DRAFT_562457 [Durotheca rogersii]
MRYGVRACRLSCLSIYRMLASGASQPPSLAEHLSVENVTRGEDEMEKCRQGGGEESGQVFRTGDLKKKKKSL